ncbi:hypothetical protein [Ruegeria arenilitoris]|uniref:hypothetical protein n=1 Tax=Ruegeria arenilitoris TaxID=1173585 RepID=UPI001479A201|nr:hypothetical protein [Ruegeria arenilitoris]
MNALATIEDEAWDDEQFVPGSHAALVNAVILKAVTDLFSANVPETDRADAFAFLTADTGSWAESRAHLCWLVDLDPDWMRECIWDILNSRREVSSLTRRGIPTLDAEHGRKHLAVVRQQEEAAKAAARVQAERARERRERKAAIQEAMDRRAREELEEERRIFEQRLKAAETEAGLRPQQRRKVVKARYAEKDGIPLGHLLRIDDPWEPGTYCTVLGTLLPSRSNSMGRAVAAACSEHGFVLEHHTRYNLDSLRQAASMLNVDLLYLDADGNPVSYSSDAVTARLRLRHPQLAA